jgi:hypothetical protein
MNTHVWTVFASLSPHKGGAVNMETLVTRLEFQRTHFLVALPLEKEREGNFEVEDEM